MADSRSPRSAREADGFTLIEVLIVVATIGVISASLAAVILTVVKAVPSTETRAADARSIQGLVTWLPQDVDAAPPDGFNRDDAYWPCAGAAPANSHNILSAEWSESVGVDLQFAASYRYESEDGSWRMVRYVCDDGGSGSMGTAERLNLTSELMDWSALSPPTGVTMCRSAVTSGASCPSADVIPESDVAPIGVHSLKLFVTRVDGAVATIDAAPKNPDQSLADDPLASPNLRPELALTNHVLKMYAGDVQTIDLFSTHGATDPEGDPISVAVDSSEPVPTGVSAVASDPMFVTVTTDAGLAAGVLSPSIVTVVSDNQGGWVDALITVEILPEPNQAPTAVTPSYVLQMTAGQTVTLPLGVTHGLADPDGDPLSASVVTYTSGLTTPPQVNSPGPLDLKIKTPGSTPPQIWNDAIVLKISDGRGGEISISVTIEIVLLSVNQSPTASPTNIAVDMYAGETLSLSLDTSHGVADPDGDPLTISAANAPTGLSVSLDGLLAVSITADPGLPVAPITTPIQFEVVDIHGADVDVTVTVNIVAAPAPPSDCVLGTLTASPSTVSRHGSGNNAQVLSQDVTVTVTFSGSCDGLALYYDTGDTSGRGLTGRNFPGGSPSSVVIFGKDAGGTEKWAAGSHELTARTTSEVSPNEIVTTLTVN